MRSWMEAEGSRKKCLSVVVHTIHQKIDDELINSVFWGPFSLYYFCVELLFSKFSTFRSNSWNVWRILSGGLGREERGGVWGLSWRLYLAPVSTALLKIKGFWKAFYHFLHQRGVCGFSAVTRIFLLGRSIIFHSCVVMGGCISQMWWHNYTV